MQHTPAHSMPHVDALGRISQVSASCDGTLRVWPLSLRDAQQPHLDLLGHSDTQGDGMLSAAVDEITNFFGWGNNHFLFPASSRPFSGGFLCQKLEFQFNSVFTLCHTNELLQRRIDWQRCISDR